MTTTHAHPSGRSLAERSTAPLRGARAPIGVAAIVYAISSWACASVPDPARFTRISQPDATAFQGPDNLGVSYFLERRCGTLDCHGQVGRALRVYGRDGLRLPNDGGITPLSGDTTQAEIAANYRAVVGLEPEQMSRVVAGGEDPETLLLLKKPLDIKFGGVQHKGGPVIASGHADPGYECLTTWLAGSTDFAACQSAAIAQER